MAPEQHLEDTKCAVYQYKNWELTVYQLPDSEFAFAWPKETEDWPDDEYADLDSLYDDEPGDAEVVGGMVKLMRAGRFGFCTRHGRMAAPCRFDYAGQFDGGLCVVGRAGWYGIIDTAGQTVVPLAYSAIRRYYELPGPAFETPESCFADLAFRDTSLAVPAYPYTAPDGQTRYLLELDDLAPYMPTLMWRPTERMLIKKAGRMGILDCAGNLRTPLVYERIAYNGIAQRGGRRGLLDGDGREVIPALYDRILKINSRMEIAEGARGDIVLAIKRGRPHRVCTENGLLLCEMPEEPYTAADVLRQILACCPGAQLDATHYALRAGERYGVLQTGGCYGFSPHGQPFGGLCIPVPFQWDDLAGATQAFWELGGAQYEETHISVHFTSEELIGPFVRTAQSDGSLPLYGIKNRENRETVLPAEYSRFTITAVEEGVPYCGFTALKAGRWYFVEINGEAKRYND